MPLPSTERGKPCFPRAAELKSVSTSAAGDVEIHAKNLQMPQACWQNIFTCLYLGLRSLCLPTYRASEDISMVGNWGSGFAPPLSVTSTGSSGPLTVPGPSLP